MNNKYILFISLLIITFTCKGSVPSIDTLNYGLTFFAHSTNQDKRTALNLTPNEPLVFSNSGFSMNFDVNLKKEKYTYGYVAKIIFDDLSCLSIISYIAKLNTENSRFNIILSDNINKKVINSKIVNKQKIIPNKWLNVNLKFSEDMIVISIDGIVAEIKHKLPNFNNVKVCFGSCKHPKFFSTDVPPMTIKDVVIRDHNDEVTHHWMLSRHSNDESYDNINQKKALVENGAWEIDKHTMWSKQMEFEFNEKNPQIAVDKESGRVYIASNTELYSYDVNSGLIDSISFEGHPYLGASSQMIYDSKRNELKSYGLTLRKIRTYDFTSNQWSIKDSARVYEFQHHSRLISTKYDELIVWGGYGNHIYNANLRRVSLEQPYKWKTISADSSICPRYLSALGGENDDNILILGGYGSPSGKQEEFPQNFYDLYRVNLNSSKIDKVWTMNNKKEHFTLSNSMVVDTLSNSIYALIYNNNRYNTFVSLARFDIETDRPSMQIVSDSLEYKFRDIHSYCDLFYNKNTKSLYAIILHETTQGKSCVELYKLAFPPIPADKIGLGVVEEKANKSIIILIVLITLFCMVGYYVYRTNIKVKTSKPKGVEEEGGEPQIDSPKSQVAKKCSQISLIGGFQVLDKDGVNITGDFTPTLKQLFILLLLSDTKNGKGITSQSLEETFWYDMSKSSASNNRNVNMRKLRVIIDKIGDVTILKKSGCWHLDIGVDVVCDYKIIMQLLTISKKQEEGLNIDTINDIVRFAAKGVLLPNVIEEWVDGYKSEYAILISETLLGYIDKFNVKDNHTLMLRISDIILSIDTIDENAIKIKCKTLHQIGQKGLSKQIFDKFYDEHINILGVSPDFSYENIVDSIP